MTVSVGENIRKLRELKGIKREYVADCLNLHITSYGNIERGQADITVSKLFRIAEVLEVSPVEIVCFSWNNSAGNTNDQQLMQQLLMALLKLNQTMEKIIDTPVKY